jgi:hypothetical protein
MVTTAAGQVTDIAGSHNVRIERAGLFDEVRAAIGDGSYLINALAVSLPAILSATVLRRRLPARGLRRSVAGCAAGIVAGLAFGAAIFAQSGLRLGIAACILGLIAGGVGGGLYEAATATDLTKAVSPTAVLARDRVTFFASIAIVLPVAACAGVTSALSAPDPFNGSRHGVAYGIGVGVALFVAIGLAYAFYQAPSHPRRTTPDPLHHRQHNGNTTKQPAEAGRRANRPVLTPTQTGTTSHQ